MGKILVFCEHQNGKIKRSAAELLSAAEGAEAVSLALGAGAKGLSGDVGSHGVKTHYASEASSAQNYNPEIYAEFIMQVFEKEKPDLILASSSALARDLFPRIAARINGSIVSDCTDLSLSGSEAKVRKPFYSGKCSAAILFPLQGPRIILMRPNQLPVKQGSGGAAAVTELSEPKKDFLTVIKDVVRGTSERLDLTEANIIVSGGRGMKGPENFKLLDELATVLGATVGASRAVCDAGWVPHSMQVGQTGKTVAPTLYIACGISGAIQHLAGMSGSKVIVAINTDANAPIFQKATYGIVGDLFQVVPALTQEFKKVLHH